MKPGLIKLPILILCGLFVVIGCFVVPAAKHPGGMAALLAGALTVILLSGYVRSRQPTPPPRQMVKRGTATPAAPAETPLGKNGLHWFSWDAHVDILLPEGLTSAWEGTKPPSDGRVIDAKFRSDPTKASCDYDRACDVEESIAPITVGSGTGIVISEAPLLTWVPQRSGGCLVLALAWSDLSDDLALQAVAQTPTAAFGAPSFTFDSPDSRLVLFAAADTYGSQFGYGHLGIDLPAGSYRVTTAEWKQDARLLLHSFQRL